MVGRPFLKSDLMDEMIINGDLSYFTGLYEAGIDPFSKQIPNQ